MATYRMGGNARKHRKKKLFMLWGYKGKAPCYWCLKVLIWETATIEHMMPRALDGSHDMINLRLACKECNQGHVNPLDVCHKKVP
jgi:5-methylcytosine-specific restriction endonuclease McrA